MPRSQAISVENTFIGGLKTEFTGLNFPENSCTETYDCVFNRIGNVNRRLGFEYELNNTFVTIDRDNCAQSSFVWRNADGEGLVDLFVVQAQGRLWFYNISAATAASPLSAHILTASVALSPYVPAESPSSTAHLSYECQYSVGDGKLFVFNPRLDPFFVVFNSDLSLSVKSILVQVRDFAGIDEPGVPVNLRPLTLTDVHRYNLSNQGWGKGWKATSNSSNELSVGSKVFAIQNDLPIMRGDRVIAYTPGSGVSDNFLIGIVTDYVGSTLTVNSTSIVGAGGTFASWIIEPQPPVIQSWYGQISNFPSNSDVWWFFKNADGVFDPNERLDDTSFNAGPANKGFFILNAFYQDRTTISGIVDVPVTSTAGRRPKTGTWFQGRVWYAGIDYPDFSENLYFSQIIENDNQLGYCFQVNDPTSEERFDLLPSDGGLIKIKGAGNIQKLFPINNGLLVFSSTGIWFITGSQGIGFTANDYTIVKVADVRTFSGTTFINVSGYPMWWNEDGIYAISPQQGQSSLTPQLITHSTISTFFEDIPMMSKQYARGSFNPLTYRVQWVYRSTPETDINDRYEYDRVLNFDTLTSAFYPWTISQVTGGPLIHDVQYVPSAPGVELSTFKYVTSLAGGTSHSFTFSEERDTRYVDWTAHSGGTNYNSYFITGYKLHGNALKKFQPEYVYMFSDNATDTAYKIQGIWDFATDPAFGKFTTAQLVNIVQGGYGKFYRRHRIRGNGVVLQLKIASTNGTPFDIMGWSILETQNPGP